LEIGLRLQKVWVIVLLRWVQLYSAACNGLLRNSVERKSQNQLLILCICLMGYLLGESKRSDELSSSQALNSLVMMCSSYSTNHGGSFAANSVSSPMNNPTCSENSHSLMENWWNKFRKYFEHLWKSRAQHFLKLFQIWEMTSNIMVELISMW
jgi:hypothetical protein